MHRWDRSSHAPDVQLFAGLVHDKKSREGRAHEDPGVRHDLEDLSDERSYAVLAAVLVDDRAGQRHIRAGQPVGSNQPSGTGT